LEVKELEEICCKIERGGKEQCKKGGIEGRRRGGTTEDEMAGWHH